MALDLIEKKSPNGHSRRQIAKPILTTSLQLCEKFKTPIPIARSPTKNQQLNPSMACFEEIIQEKEDEPQTYSKKMNEFFVNQGQQSSQIKSP